MNSQEQNFAAFIGIDWADEKHAVWMQAEGLIVEGELQQRAEDLDAWAADLRQRFSGQPVAVCLEQSRGALIYALLKYDFLVLFPINPKQASRYREALHPSGRKDDPLDAAVLGSFLVKHHRQLRPWRPDDACTRLLRLFSEDRRHVVDERTACKNRLRQRLKEVFPLALELVGSDLANDWFLRLLVKFPSHAELRKASVRTLERLLPKRRRVPDDETLDPRITRIRTAAALVTDPSIVQAGALAVVQFAKLLLQLNASVAEYDRALAAELAKHPDAELFKSFPGVGDSLAPRMAAVFGTDRERYVQAEDVQQLSGIAPVIVASGKSRTVRRRRACPKFVRQTFHEHADHSRKASCWARAYYRLLRSRGKGHHAALRALAFKWQRILFRCWQTRTPYDEARHLFQLRLKNSNLLPFLETAQEQQQNG